MNNTLNSDIAAAIDVEPASRIEGMRPYASPPVDHRIDCALDANEGPPTSYEWRGALAGLSVEDLRRYPDAGALEADLARLHGVDASRIVVTAGGDDAIHRICQAMLEPGRAALLHTPTFEMIERGARLAGADIQRVRWFDGPFPEEAFIERMTGRTRLVACVSPNNPTGRTIDGSTLVRIARAAASIGAVMLADLAYVEFDEDDATRVLIGEPNVVIVRTFSKALGMAGARIGYAVTSERIATWLRTTGGPFPVSSISLAIAGAAAGRRFAPDADVIAATRQRRAQLVETLEAIGFDPLPSRANFVLTRCPDIDWCDRGLRSLGIAVRRFAKKEELADHLRMTVATNESDHLRVLHALATIARPEALLLDLDGVLADVSQSYRAAIIATSGSFGVKITAEDVAAAKVAGDANNDWDLTRRLLLRAGVTVSRREVIDRFQTIYRGDERTPGLREREALIPSTACIRQLADRLPLAIVTGRPGDEARWFLQRFGLGECSQVTVTMEDAPPKPSAEPVRLALDRLGVERAWMIGDTPDDMRAASAAGVIPLGVIAPGDDDDAARVALRTAGASRVLATLDEVLEMLP